MKNPGSQNHSSSEEQTEETKETEETHLVVFPVQGVLCNLFSKFRIDLDFGWFKRSHFGLDCQNLWVRYTITPGLVMASIEHDFEPQQGCHLF